MATVITWVKRLFLFSVVGLVAAALIFAFMPQPVVVDLVSVERGELTVTIRDEGQTRVRDRYQVSAPVNGQMQRLFVKEGDEVIAGETVLAQIVPAIPQLLDAREKLRSESLVKAAEGRLDRSESDLRRVREELEKAKVDANRAQQLWKDKAVSDSEYELAQLALRQRTEALKSAELTVQISGHELEIEKTTLQRFEQSQSPGAIESRIDVYSPISGRVLRLNQESARVVTVGLPLVEVGDPRRLEVISDMLSNDAVKIRNGQKTKFVHWGGDEDLPAVVRLVEPSGFTKISALGVEEQRVNVLSDFDCDPAEYETLGDGYRVEVEIEIWSKPDALKVPASALFRQGREWAVFQFVDGKAISRSVQIGQNNGLFAEVLDGLKEGDQVVSHPSDQVQEDVRIRPRG